MFLKLAFFSVIFSIMIFPPNSFAQAPPVEPGVSQTLAKWRAANYSDVRYKLNITLEKQAPLMKGGIEIRVNLTEEGAKNDLILDWRTTQFANDKDEPYANVVAVNETTDAERTGAQASRLHRRDSGETAFLVNSSFSQTEAFSRSALMASGTLALQSLAVESNEHLIIPKKFLKTGENVIKIEFASPIKTSGAAVTRYVDKEDGAEYVYSLFVPSDASTAFPVFDQPDLKARFSLGVKVIDDWAVISNAKARLVGMSGLETSNGIIDKSIFWIFEETPPISPYVFAFAAGNFEVLKDENSSIPSKLYVRRSQVSKIKNATSRSADVSSASEESSNSTGGRDVRAPISGAPIDEVFRLNREAIKYLENYFDYKFPFPKYDLVLIPEFPFGGMEHAGATFLREDRVIFPTEPTKNDYITRANLIFHEAAHQWFGDTVTMKWFDDLWLKEGFAEFMAYKTLEKVMPEYNAWKVFYERNKQAAYLTDVTRGTTPIYQEIPNLSSAKSAYGNIVYRKAPSFLRQAEFYLGEDKFQTAVRAFLKKHEFANAEWTDLVKEFETASKQDLKDWANVWVKKAGVPIIRTSIEQESFMGSDRVRIILRQSDSLNENGFWQERFIVVSFGNIGDREEKFYIETVEFENKPETKKSKNKNSKQITIFWSGVIGLGPINIPRLPLLPRFVFPNYQDYGYGIFLLDRNQPQLRSE